MPNQEALFSTENGLEFSIYEAEPHEGELKLQQPKCDGPPLTIITPKRKTNFKIKLQLVSCIHGKLNPESCGKSTPASLIIFEYRLHCLEKDHVFSSTKLTINFQKV